MTSNARRVSLLCGAISAALTIGFGAAYSSAPRTAEGPRTVEAVRTVEAPRLAGAAGASRDSTDDLSQRSKSGVPSVAPRAGSLVVVAGGDVSFGRETGQRLLRDPELDPFAELAPLLAGDLRFVNLESPLSHRDGETRHPRKPLTFVGPPTGARALRCAGIDIVSLANNHVWDYGPSAFFETLDHLEAAGVAYVGATRGGGRPDDPTILKAGGWSVAWFAVTNVWNLGAEGMLEAEPYVAFAHGERMAARVAQMRSDHDLVIVSYHGGKEYSENVSREASAFARAVMGAGADVMIGHHPHVPQGVEWFEGRPALYSLGNLVFETHRDHAWTSRGFLARLEFREGRSVALDMCAYRKEDGLPVPVGAHGALPVYHRYLARVTSHAGFTRVGAPDARGCFRLEPHTALASHDSTLLAEARTRAVTSD